MDVQGGIFIAGHLGLVGSAVRRALEGAGHRNLILKSRAELDLVDQAAVESFFAKEKPAIVVLAAARVGGILANSQFPAEFIQNNLAIQTNVIHSAWRNGTRKLVFLGSSCIYPRDCPQPIREEYLLSGPLEPTNEAYAVAKIAGLKMCEAYRQQYGFDAISLMPTNLYGPGDNFDPGSSHVLPAMIRRFHAARQEGLAEVAIWGTGTPKREFLHVDDLAQAVILMLDRSSGHSLINVGAGRDISIFELARMVAEVVGYGGRISVDPSKPDGTPRKLLNIDRLRALGWVPRIELRDGLEKTYHWWLAHLDGDTQAVRSDAV